MLNIISNVEKKSYRYKLSQIFKNKNKDDIYDSLDDLNYEIYPHLDKIAIRVLSMKVKEDFELGLLDDYLYKLTVNFD